MKMETAMEDELDSDNEEGVDLDLRMWLSQLDSSATPSATKHVSSLKSRSSTEVCQASKAEEQQEIDFDSILGQLSSLDDQFDNFGENETTLSKSFPPESPKVTEKVAAPAQNFNAAASRDTKIADDFGDINSLLMNAIFELNQLVSDDVTQPPSAEVKEVPPTVEVSQRPVLPGSTVDTPHLPQQPPDAKKPLAEEKSQKPPSAVRTSAQSDVGSRGETVSLKSTDSSSSSSVTQSGNSCRSSGQSNAALKNLPQVCIKVFSLDGSSVSVSVNQRTTVGRLCEIIAQKNQSDRNRFWGISEQIPDLLMQRLLEDHQFILEELHAWPKETNNHLVFLETPKKYCMFIKSQILNESKWKPKELDGWLHLKAEGKKAWKKLNFVLRDGEILCNVKGKGKPELSCLRRLSEVNVCTGVGWKKKFKAPSEFGFALKPPATQNKSAKDIEYVCADDEETMWKWVTGIRVVKFGFQLYRNFRHFVCPEENGPKPNAVSASTANCQGNKTSTERQKSRTSEGISSSEEGHAMKNKQQESNQNQCTGTGITAESLPNGSGRTKAQIPVTAQTARLLSTQPSSPSPALTLSCPVGGRRDTHTRQPPVDGTHEQQHANAETALPRAMHQTAMGIPSSRCRPGSPDLPPPPPPELLTCPSLHRTLSSDAASRAKSGHPPPPAPPRRDESTQLSLQRRPKTENNATQTKNFVLNLQRTIGQKCKHGAEGFVQLEMPLPPPPLYSDEPSYLDLGDLPPPPAELLDELKVMKMRKPKQPPPPTPVKCRR